MLCLLIPVSVTTSVKTVGGGEEEPKAAALSP